MVFSGASLPALKSDDLPNHHPDRGTVVTRPGRALDGRRKQLSGSQRTGESLSSHYWGSSTDLDSPLTTHASTRVSLLLEFSLLGVLHRSGQSSHYSRLYAGRFTIRVLTTGGHPQIWTVLSLLKPLRG
jgi:hypothetical protein